MSKSEGGFSNGSGFRFVTPSPDSVEDDFGFGFLASAGQYRNWNWREAMAGQYHSTHT